MSLIKTYKKYLYSKKEAEIFTEKILSNITTMYQIDFSEIKVSYLFLKVLCSILYKYVGNKIELIEFKGLDKNEKVFLKDGIKLAKNPEIGDIRGRILSELFKD